MKNTLLILLLLPALILAQNTPKQGDKKSLDIYQLRDKYLFAARPVEKNFTKTIAFEYSGDQVIVPVYIDGKSYNFMFDTGAATVISNELKELLGQPAITTNNMTDGAGRTEEQEIYPLPPVGISGVTFTGVVAVAADLARFNTLFCMKIDGILGTNIMRTCYWKLDYKNQLLTFSSNRIKPGKNTVGVDFEENFSGSPMLKLFMGEYHFMALVDTGYNGGLALPDSLFFKSRKSKELRTKKGFGVQAMTLFDSSPQPRYVAALDSVFVGNRHHLIKGGVASIDASPMILIGSEILSRYGEIVFDWKKKKMYIPVGDLTVSSVYETYGFSPRFSQGKAEINLVWEDSDAHRHGMETGDIIMQMNGYPTSGISDAEWCKFVDILTSESETPLSITVRKRDGREVSYSLPRVNLLME